MRRSLGVVGVIVLALACTKPSSSQSPPPGGGDSQGASDPHEGDAPGQADRADEHAGVDVRGPVLPDGARCDADADCGEGQLCEGLGCGTNEGRCASRDRICTRDLARYCGCDGAPFQASGSCPGARFAYRGPCEPELEDGEPCADGHQCRSGQCVGEGLEGCDAHAGGVCGRSACTCDLVTYCGCNGVEFTASGTCPDRQFGYRGPCEATGG